MERIRNVTTAGGSEFLRVSTGIAPGVPASTRIARVLPPSRCEGMSARRRCAGRASVRDPSWEGVVLVDTRAKLANFLLREVLWRQDSTLEL